MTTPAAAPEHANAQVTAEKREVDTSWVTVVHNDPVNLMSYVTYVLRKLFGYPKDQATKLMLQVHTEGQAIVSSGTREKMELDAQRLHAYGLWATVRRD